MPAPQLHDSFRSSNRAVLLEKSRRHRAGLLFQLPLQDVDAVRRGAIAETRRRRQREGRLQVTPLFGVLLLAVRSFACPCYHWQPIAADYPSHQHRHPEASPPRSSKMPRKSPADSPTSRRPRSKAPPRNRSSSLRGRRRRRPSSFRRSRLGNPNSGTGTIRRPPTTIPAPSRLSTVRVRTARGEGRVSYGEEGRLRLLCCCRWRPAESPLCLPVSTMMT